MMHCNLVKLILRKKKIFSQTVNGIQLRYFFCCYNFQNAAPLQEIFKEPRYNALGIQMLPEKLHKQIFKECYLKDSNFKVDKAALQGSFEQLAKFNIGHDKPDPSVNINFTLPQFKGKNINNVFTNFAAEQAGPYAESLHELINNSLPRMPEKHIWLKKPGWTKYTIQANGTFVTESVDLPTCSALVFDCEVLVNFSDIPIIAVAASKNAWYSWTSQHVLKENSKLKNDLEFLVPIEGSCKSSSNAKQTPTKLIVGHNVGYDRARIKEQYFPEERSTRFLDTMSMHIAVSGFSAQQRMKTAGLKNDDDEHDQSSVLESSWVNSGSLNNLSAVHKFYCGKALDKSTREVFVKGDINDVKEDFNNLMEYCANDVKATYNVLQKLTPRFFSHFPHVATFAGMLELGQMYLPVNKNWNRYVQSCQQEYDSLNMELKKNLVDLMNDACHLFHNARFRDDKWLWDLDWSVSVKKLIKSPRKGFQAPEPFSRKLTMYLQNHSIITDQEFDQLGKTSMTLDTNCHVKKPLSSQLIKMANRLSLVQTHMPGYPKWYSELHLKQNDSEWTIDSTKLSTLTRATPKLLRMTWMSFPLHYGDKLGWGYLVPKDKFLNAEELSNNVKSDQYAFGEIEEKEAENPVVMTHTPAETLDGLPGDSVFHRLPHKNGIGNNVGSPLSHDFINHIDSGILSSADFSNAKRCLEINKLCSYWRSAQQRILSQMRIPLDDGSLTETISENASYNKDLGFEAIVPQVSVCGTISRRAVERTWLTASNVESDRIGSELKSMVQAPPGFVFVGADVDSQELWIASLLGDASSAREHGCTPLSWMTLNGNKKHGTDLHSKTAQAIGMTRNEAKVFNYARMYGAGKQAALRMYMQHNQGIPKAECISKINKLYSMTKGNLLYKLSSTALWIVKKTNVHISVKAKTTQYATFEEITKIQKAAVDAFGHAKLITKKDLVDGTKWNGGIESHMFNAMSDIATSESPQTPFLKCKISSALVPSKVHSNFLPSRMNWVVQSSAVDYLHLLVVAMRWLISTYNLEARFILSIHDEVRYLSSKRHQYSVALALQIANLLTRCMFAYQLGMHDLPQSVAFFSSVEIDHVIRKECTDNCITPSNPNGLENKYGIPLGESVDIHDILKITNGQLGYC